MSFITSPGVVGFSNVQNTTAPNTPVYVSYFRGISPNPSVDVAMVPKGLGAVLANIPDGTAVGGNKRGSNAVDLQSGPQNLNTQVASGANSVISGGLANTASGQFSQVTGGFQNTAAGASSRVGGRSASDFGMAGVDVYQPQTNNADGDTTSINAVMWGLTNAAGATWLTTLGGTNFTNNQADRSFVMKNQSVMSFDIDVLAIGNGTGEFAAYNIRGAARRGGNAASSSIIGAPVVTTVGTSAGYAALVAPTIVADVANGGWAVACTGLAGITIKWQGNVRAQFSQF